MKTNPLNRISLEDVFKHEWVTFKSCNFRSSNKNKSVIVDPNSIKFDKYSKIDLEKQFSQASIDIDIGSYRKNDSETKLQHKSSFNIRDIRNVSATPNPTEDKIFEFKNYVVNNNSSNSNTLNNKYDPFSNRTSNNNTQTDNEMLSKKASKIESEFKYIDNPENEDENESNKNESIFAKFCNILDKKNSVSKKSLNVKKVDSEKVGAMRKNTFNAISDNKINNKFYFDETSNRESLIENISKNSQLLEEKKSKINNINITNSNFKGKNDNSMLSSNRPTAIMESHDPGLFMFEKSNDAIIPEDIGKDKNSIFFVSFAANCFPGDNHIKDNIPKNNFYENENNVRTYTEESSGFIVASERVTGEHFKKITNRKIVDNLPVNDSLNNSFTSNKTENELDKDRTKIKENTIGNKEEKINSGSTISKLINNLKTDNSAKGFSEYLGNSDNNVKDNYNSKRELMNKIPKSPNTNNTKEKDYEKGRDKESTISPNSKSNLIENSNKPIPMKLDFSNKNMNILANDSSNIYQNKMYYGSHVLNDKKIDFLNKEEVYYEENDMNSNLLTIMNINYEGTGGTSSRLNQNKDQIKNQNFNQGNNLSNFSNINLDKKERSSNKNGNLYIGLKSNSIDDKLMFNDNCDSFGKKLSNNNVKDVEGFSIDENKSKMTNKDKSSDMILSDNKTSKLIFNNDLSKFDSEIPIRNDKILDSKSPYITSSFKNNFRKSSEVEIIKTDSDEKFPIKLTEKKISNISNDKKELSFKSGEFLNDKEFLSKSNLHQSKNNINMQDSMSLSLKNNKETDYFSSFKNSKVDQKNGLKHTNSFNLQSSGNLTTKSKFSNINFNLKTNDSKTPCIINLFFDEKEIDMVNENKIKNDISKVNLNTKIENGISNKKEDSNSGVNRFRSDSIGNDMKKTSSTNKLIIRSK